MKKLLLLLLISSGVYGQSDDTTKYIHYRYTYGNRMDRYWANKALRPPTDTIYGKFGLAIKSGQLYWGNETWWTAAGAGTVTASNGLTKTVNDIALGGTLTGNTTIATTSSYNLTVSGSTPIATANGLLIITNSAASARAVYISATSTGSAGLEALVSDNTAIVGRSNSSGVGLQGETQTGIGVFSFAYTNGNPFAAALRSSNTNEVKRLGYFHRDIDGVSAADGIGGSVDFLTTVTGGGGNISNQLISKWTTAASATRTSQFTITRVNNGTTLDGLVLEGDGRLYGTGLHNAAGAVTGTTNQYIASGTYTPALTNVTNVAASTAYACQWMRVGNVVTVSGKVDIDATGAGATELGLSLPVASAMTVENNLGGDAISAAAASLSAAVRADATNDRAAIVFTATSITNDSYFFTFTYLIL